MDGRRGSKDLAAHYRSLLEEQTESGLSVTDFAEEVGVSSATLYSWRRRLAGRGKPARLVEVEVVGRVEDEGKKSLVVQVGRFRIEVPTEFDEDALSRLVRTLERC